MELMQVDTFLWTTLGAFLTLCTFSFLYKDNPFYKFAEHAVVGVSAGYFAIILWHTGLQPKLFNQLRDGDWFFLWLNASGAHYIIPAILGIMMWTRFSQKLSWVSRWPIAMYMGIAAGLAVPQEMKARVIEQMYSAMYNTLGWGSFFGTGFYDSTSGLSQIIIFIGTLSALFYFFFSKEHTGFFKGVSRFGLWILMIGFGASFGYTVMGRISLFVQRIQFLGDWTRVVWDDRAGALYMLFWVLTFGIFAVMAIYEIVSFARRKQATS